VAALFSSAMAAMLWVAEATSPVWAEISRVAPELCSMVWADALHRVHDAASPGRHLLGSRRDTRHVRHRHVHGGQDLVQRLAVPGLPSASRPQPETSRSSSP